MEFRVWITDYFIKVLRILFLLSINGKVIKWIIGLEYV